MRQRADAADRRADLLAAAAALLEREGTVAAVSLRGVAREAGVSAPAVYGHFADLDRLLDEGAYEMPPVRVVDFHCELTSEKNAFGLHLDGRVSAVVGTHTHVPTADARVLPGGTAYITDVGMTGPRGGVIGVRKEQSIRGFVTHMNERYETSEDDPWLMGVLVRCSQPMAADAIEQVLLPAG